MKSNKLLIIGGGINQRPIIQAAKKEGYYVIAVAPRGKDELGAMFADEAFCSDIFDIDAIEKFARENSIGGILTDQSDMATPIVAKLAERLGLPGIGYENSLCFTDKSRMRDVFNKIGLPVAKNVTVDNFESALSAASELGYPVVIKPVDSFSSRGVYLIEDDEQMHQKFSLSMKASRLGRVILEKYIKGPQFFSQGYVEDGKLRLFAFSDRYYFDVPDVFLPYTSAFPAKINEKMKKRMTEDFNKVIEYLKPSFGQVWAEWIYDDNEDVLYIIEMAIRGAGAMVTTDVIPNAYCIDTQPYLVNEAMSNRKESFFDAELQEEAAAFYCFLVPPGEIIKAEGLDEISKIPGVVGSQVKEIHVGDIMEPYKDKSSRFGPIVVKGHTRDDLDRIRERLMETVKIEVMTADGIRNAAWE